MDIDKQITIVSTCRMGPGTFEAKFIPLSMLEEVQSIIVVRKEEGPPIPKLSYCVLPKLCQNPLLNLIITPFVIARQVHKHRASLILAYHYVPHYYLAFVASLLSMAPYILGQTGSDDQKLASKPLQGLLLRMVLRKARYINVPGKKTGDFWRSMGYRNVNILHSSIDTDYFTPLACEKQYDFIYVGRLENYKGTHKIINAMHRLVQEHPEAKLAIVGYGSQETNLKRMTQELCLSGNVTFNGFQEDTRAWLYKARIFVMASETEGLPCALMEAMSCGMVCISSIVGNIGDIIKDGITGFGFEPLDEKRLFTLMKTLYYEERNLETIKKAARRVIIEGHSYLRTKELWREELKSIRSTL